MNKLLRALLSGLFVAFIFIILRPKLGVWTFVIVAVTFPIIFWLAQAFIDILNGYLKREK